MSRIMPGRSWASFPFARWMAETVVLYEVAME